MSKRADLRTYLRAVLVIALAGGIIAGCGGSSKSKAGQDRRPYSPVIRPAEFSTTIDNPYLPFVPGSRWVYEAKTRDGTERIVVEVTSETKEIMGVTCVVVRDTVSIDGRLFEDTFDWYAQHRDGTVWYFGEDTTEYEDGKPSKKGSWEAGVDGAKPGVVMQAQPRVGQTYRQEYYKGEAEDMGKVLSTNESASVPTGDYGDVVKIRDFTPLEPGLVEHKYFARGVGVVLEATVRGGNERVELVEYTTP